MPNYETTAEQRAQLSSDGFALLAGALTDGLLSRLRDLAERLEATALEAHSRNESLHGDCVIEDPVGPRLMRYDDILGQDADAVLDLLACPAMMAVAREMCGDDAVPLNVDILYKHPPRTRSSIGIREPLIREAIPTSTSESISTMRIPAIRAGHTTRAAGYLRALASPWVGDSQCRAATSQSWRHIGSRHDGPAWFRAETQFRARRTVYVELRAVAGIRESQKQSERWAELRKRWMAMVVRRAEARDVPQQWRETLPDDLGREEEDIRTILSTWEPPIPAVYCHRAVSSNDYPVPSDLREA